LSLSKEESVVEPKLPVILGKRTHLALDKLSKKTISSNQKSSKPLKDTILFRNRLTKRQLSKKMGLHRRAKMKLKKQLSNRESVQDNNSINLMNAINSLGLANWQSVRKSNKRIRSMEIESNSFSDSSKRR
jgi:hypothetical protein